MFGEIWTRIRNFNKSTKFPINHNLQLFKLIKEKSCQPEHIILVTSIGFLVYTLPDILFIQRNLFSVHILVTENSTYSFILLHALDQHRKFTRQILFHRHHSEILSATSLYHFLLPLFRAHRVAPPGWRVATEKLTWRRYANKRMELTGISGAFARASTVENNKVQLVAETPIMWIFHWPWSSREFAHCQHRAICNATSEIVSGRRNEKERIYRNKLPPRSRDWISVTERRIFRAAKIIDDVSRGLFNGSSHARARFHAERNGK